MMPTLYLQLEKEREEANLARERQAEREMLERHQREYEEKKAAEDRLREEEEEEERKRRRRRAEEERRRVEARKEGETKAAEDESKDPVKRVGRAK